MIFLKLPELRLFQTLPTLFSIQLSWPCSSDKFTLRPAERQTLERDLPGLPGSPSGRWGASLACQAPGRVGSKSDFFASGGLVSSNFDQIPTVKQSTRIAPPSAPPAVGEAAAGPAATLRTRGRCRCSYSGWSAGHCNFLRVLLWPRGREAKTRCRRCEAVSGLNSKL